MSNQDDRKEIQNLSRRRFFGSAGTFLAGAAVTAAGGTMLANKVMAKPVDEKPVSWPYPYVKLDPEDIRSRAYVGYYKDKCAYAVFNALVSALREKVGYPYTVMPTEMMNWARGGGWGEAATCGTIIGGCSAVSLVCDKKTAKKIIMDVFNWYQQTSLPTAMTQKLAHEMKFPVKKYKDTRIFKPTIADSPLCHVSVTRFCKENGFKSHSKQRAERCARLAADVAHFITTRLNSQVGTRYVSELSMSASTAGCRRCHAEGKPFKIGGWTRGKMDCEPCHGKDMKVSKNHFMGAFKKG